ncbi:hypothetical protein EJ05DRAFT_440002, partial [Pseudovirgaria hyperparasitica]
HIRDDRSVVGRTLHSSTWPVLLHSDTASIIGVQRRVNVISWFQTALLMIVAIAAVVTPLGLYETVGQEHSFTKLSFQYVKDPSPMGYGTPQRSGLGPSRVCFELYPVNCPWTDNNISTIINDTGVYSDLPNGYDPSVPQNLTDFFSSGLEKFNASASSVFDIQWRNYRTKTDDLYNGKEFLIGLYRPLQSMILNDAIEPVEGLIVNTKTGGIGFRNHSVPPPLKYGGSWTEDLLWIEPETQCVDMNTTLDMTIPEYNSGQRLANLVLTDRGGFAEFDKQLPTYDLSHPQLNPNLYDRARFAAIYNNIYTMLYLNITNPGENRFSYLDSTVGKEFDLGNTSMIGGPTAYYDRLVTSSTYGSYLSLESNASYYNASYDAFNASNPWSLTTSNFTAIGDSCLFDAGGRQRANISAISLACGVVYGAARPADGVSTLIYTPGSRWSVPMYSCVSAAKASLKTVSFQYSGNGTADFRALKVVDVADKAYDNEDDKPLWGVEDLYERVYNVKPVWGLVADRYQNTPNITTLRSEQLWLPGPVDSLTVQGASAFQNMPGIDFYRNALASAYNVGNDILSQVGTNVDYTGGNSLALYAKWQEYSQHANTTAKAINLIWTDVAANAVAGSRGWVGYEGYKNLGKREYYPNKDGALVPITLNIRTVKYHLPYAIPGIIALVLLLITLVSALVMVVLGRAKNDKIRQFLNSTSAGRLMTTFLYTHDAHPDAHKKQWLAQVGRKRVNITGPYPLARDPTQSAASPFSPSAANRLDDKMHHVNTAYQPQPSPVSSEHTQPLPQQPPSHFMHANQGYAYVPPAPPPPPVPHFHNDGYQEYAYVPPPAPYDAPASVQDSRSAGGDARYERVRMTDGDD